jgi:hypothetical protein
VTESAFSDPSPQYTDPANTRPISAGELTFRPPKTDDYGTSYNPVKLAMEADHRQNSSTLISELTLSHDRPILGLLIRRIDALSRFA